MKQFSMFDLLLQARRHFCMKSLHGAGAFVLASLLQKDGVTTVDAAESDSIKAIRARTPHFPGRAKRCIYIYLEGGPSQMDLFDPKPELNRLDGQPLPQSLTKTVQFAFLQKETARVLGTPRTFQRYGESGMEFSDLLPHLASCADDLCMVRSMQSDQFNHVPAQLLMNCGSSIVGRPSIGSWLTYGLGSEADDLPAFVSLVTAAKSLPGGSASWSSGFLPSSFAGVRFGNRENPVINIASPDGISTTLQHHSVQAINKLNRIHQRSVNDPELSSRIQSYELAFRFQSSAPELVDLSGETQETLKMYGLNRVEPEISENRGGKGLFRAFSYNCLLARRLVQRGVRVVNIIHSSWDHHSRLNVELPHNALMVDQPLAALIKDLKRHGMLDDTLVVIGSEFGRTPLGENRPGFQEVSGRDHHPLAFTILLAGGGVRAGHIVGATDDIGWNVVQDPVHVHDLHATLLHLFGLDHKRLTYRHQGRDFRLTDVGGQVISQILS